MGGEMSIDPYLNWQFCYINNTNCHLATVWFHLEREPEVTVRDYCWYNAYLQMFQAIGPFEPSFIEAHQASGVGG